MHTFYYYLFGHDKLGWGCANACSVCVGVVSGAGFAKVNRFNQGPATLGRMLFRPLQGASRQLLVERRGQVLDNFAACCCDAPATMTPSPPQESGCLAGRQPLLPLWQDDTRELLMALCSGALQGARRVAAYAIAHGVCTAKRACGEGTLVMSLQKP